MYEALFEFSCLVAKCYVKVLMVKGRLAVLDKLLKSCYFVLNPLNVRVLPDHGCVFDFNLIETLVPRLFSSIFKLTNIAESCLTNVMVIIFWNLLFMFGI